MGCHTGSTPQSAGSRICIEPCRHRGQRPSARNAAGSFEELCKATLMRQKSMQATRKSGDFRVKPPRVEKDKEDILYDDSGRYLGLVLQLSLRLSQPGRSERLHRSDHICTDVPYEWQDGDVWRLVGCLCVRSDSQVQGSHQSPVENGVAVEDPTTTRCPVEGKMERCSVPSGPE